MIVPVRLLDGHEVLRGLALDEVRVVGDGAPRDPVERLRVRLGPDDHLALVRLVLVVHDDTVPEVDLGGVPDPLDVRNDGLREHVHRDVRGVEAHVAAVAGDDDGQIGDHGDLLGGDGVGGVGVQLQAHVDVFRGGEGVVRRGRGDAVPGDVEDAVVYRQVHFPVEVVHVPNPVRPLALRQTQLVNRLDSLVWSLATKAGIKTKAWGRPDRFGCDLPTNCRSKTRGGSGQGVGITTYEPQNDRQHTDHFEIRHVCCVKRIFFGGVASSHPQTAPHAPTRE